MPCSESTAIFETTSAIDKASIKVETSTYARLLHIVGCKIASIAIADSRLPHSLVVDVHAPISSIECWLKSV